MTCFLTLTPTHGVTMGSHESQYINVSHGESRGVIQKRVCHREWPLCAPDCAILAPGRGTGTDPWVSFRGLLRSGPQMTMHVVAIPWTCRAYSMRLLCARRVHSMRMPCAFSVHSMSSPCPCRASYREHAACILCVVYVHDVSPPCASS